MGPHFFGILDSHLPLFRTGSHNSAVGECARVVKTVERMSDVFHQELFDAGQVALRPIFKCFLADAHKGQLRH